MEENMIEFELTERNTPKKQKIVLEISSEMEDYAKLLKMSLYDEVFLLLEERVGEIKSPIERSVHIRNVFAVLFDYGVFKDILNKNNILHFARSFTTAVKEKAFLSDLGSKINQFVVNDMTGLMLAHLIKGNEFELARFLIPMTKTNLEDYNTTVADITRDNNIEALDFVCSHMNNIHFNEGALLRIACEMEPSAIFLLVDKYGFDINQQSTRTGANLISALISDNQVKNFKAVVQKYGDRIKWGTMCINNETRTKKSLFDLMDETENKNDFYSLLLEDLTLKPAIIERIANSVFKDERSVENALELDLFSKLFSHPSFDPQIINLNQTYCIYGLLSQIGVRASSGNEDVTKMYIKVLEVYLKNYTEKNVPESTDYHVVGAALWVADATSTKFNSKAVLDIVPLILRHFPQYINRPNPSGDLPIMQVEFESNLYRMLVNHGAVPRTEEGGFWNSISSAFGKKKLVVDPGMLEKAKNKVEEVKVTPFTNLRAQLNNEFKELRTIIENPLCDSKVQFKCENLFLKAEHLVLMMEKHNLVNSFQELHFLSENFSRYLSKSLKTYLKVCEATVDFAESSQQEEKLGKAKEQCLEQVDIINEQLDVIRSNTFTDVENEARTNASVHSRFLKQRFEATTKNLSLDDLDENKPVHIHTATEASAPVENNTVSINIPTSVENPMKNVENDNFDFKIHQEKSHREEDVDEEKEMESGEDFTVNILSKKNKP